MYFLGESCLIQIWYQEVGHCYKKKIPKSVEVALGPGNKFRLKEF